MHITNWEQTPWHGTLSLAVEIINYLLTPARGYVICTDLSCYTAHCTDDTRSRTLSHEHPPSMMLPRIVCMHACQTLGKQGIQKSNKVSNNRSVCRTDHQKSEHFR